MTLRTIEGVLGYTGGDDGGVGDENRYLPNVWHFGRCIVISIDKLDNGLNSKGPCASLVSMCKGLSIMLGVV